MNDPKPSGTHAGDPLWAQYEQEIRTLVAALDSNATVVHNARVPGKLSASPRQIDVWATGVVVGQKISIAIECKRTGRPVTVETIDSFIGKLLDIGADRGIMYSYSGFSNSATARAFSASNPSLLPIALQTPKTMFENREALDCPAGSLMHELSPRWADEMDEFEYMEYFKSGNDLNW